MNPERRIEELEERVKGDGPIEEELEAERLAIEEAERKAQERFKRIARKGYEP